MAAVFCQSRRGDRVGRAESVYSLAPGSGGEIVHAELASVGNGLLLTIAEKQDGPGNKAVSVYTRRLEKGKWREYASLPQVKAKGEWTVVSCGGGLQRQPRVGGAGWGE